MKAYKAALLAAESIPDDNVEDEERSRHLEEYRKLVDDLRQTPLIGSRDLRRVLDSADKRLGLLQSDLVYSEAQSCAGKRGPNRTHGDRQRRPGAVLGASITPKSLVGRLIDVVACALGNKDRDLVYPRIKYSILKQANDLKVTSPLISNALFQAWNGEFVGLKNVADRITFRLTFSSIVEASFGVQVRIATTCQEALVVWREIETRQSEILKPGTKRVAILGFLDAGFGRWGALQVDPYAKAKQDESAKQKLAQAARLAEYVEKAREKAAAASVKRAEKKRAELLLATQLAQALAQAEEPAVEDESTEGQGSTKRNLRSKTKTTSRKDESVPPPNIPSGRIPEGPAPPANEEDEVMHPESSSEQPPLSSSRSEPSATEKVTGQKPSHDPRTMRFSTISRKVPARFRTTIEGGLTHEEIQTVKEVFDGLVDDISLKARESSEILTLAVHLVLGIDKDGLENADLCGANNELPPSAIDLLHNALEDNANCPEFSLSPRPKMYSAVREAYVDSMVVGCEPTAGELTEVKTDAVNVAYNIYREAAGDDSIRPDRRRGDAYSIHDEAHSMEINLSIHVSAPKARLFIIGNIDTLLERTLGVRLQNTLLYPQDTKTRTLHVNVMDTVSLRKAVAFEMFDRFAHHFEDRDGKKGKGDWEAPELSTKMLSQKNKVRTFLASFDSTEIMEPLRAFWTKLDEAEEKKEEEDEEDDEEAAVRKASRMRKNKYKNYKEADDDDDDDEEDRNNVGADDEDPDEEGEEIAALERSKNHNAFELALHPKNDDISMTRWAILALYQKMIKLRRSWLTDAQVHGFWTPPSTVADDLTGVEKENERPQAVPRGVAEEDDDEDDDLVGLRAEEPPPPVVTIHEDELIRCKRASHKCRRLFDLLPLNDNRARFITLRSIERLLPPPILLRAEEIIENIYREWQQAEGTSLARRKRPSLLSAIFILPNVLDGKSFIGREQQLRPSILYNSETIVARIKVVRKVAESEDILWKARTQARLAPHPSPFNFSIPKTKTDREAEEAVLQAARLAKVTTATAILADVKKYVSDESFLRAATENVSNFYQTNPGCAGCGKKGCLLPSTHCGCYGHSNWCKKNCKCSAVDCGNRFQFLGSQGYCENDACTKKASKSDLFVCGNGNQSFACGRSFHKSCFSIAGSTRCRACFVVFEEQRLLTLRKNAKDAAKNGPKAIQVAEEALRRAQEDVRKHSPIPSSSGQADSSSSNPTSARQGGVRLPQRAHAPIAQPPQRPSPKLVLLGIFAGTLNILKGSISENYVGSEEVFVDDPATGKVRRLKMTTGTIGNVDVDSIAVLTHLHDTPSVSVRYGLYGTKTTFTRQLPMHFYVYGEETVRQRVQRIISARRQGMPSRSYLPKEGEKDVPSDWFLIKDPNSSDVPPPSVKKEHKKEDVRDYEGGFGSDKSDPEKLQHARSLRPRAQILLGIAAQELIAIQAKRDERAAALKKAAKSKRKNSAATLPRAVSKKDYAIAARALQMASKRLSVLNLIISVGGRIRIVSIDNGRRNNCYGVERRPDGTEKVWQLARGHWRDKKGDDTRMRSSRIRIEHLAEQIKILSSSPSACGDAKSFLAHMVVTASVRKAIMAEKMKPVWRKEAFEAFRARHSALDKFVAEIERGEPEHGTGGKRQCIVVMGDGSFASNARGSRSVPTVETRKAFVTKFGEDAVVEISEHRSTKCCNGCGCVLAKLFTDLHSRFSQRRFAKKLGKKEEDFAAGRSTVEPEPHQHSRRIEGLIQCTSSEERCPLYGGRKLDRDGNAARSIGDAFFAWLNCMPPPSFMERVHHPEDVTPEPINVTRGSSPLLRFLKERYPRPALDTTINVLLSTFDIAPLQTSGISALISGVDVPREVFVALLTHFGPMLMQYRADNDEDEEDAEENKEAVPQPDADFEAAEVEEKEEEEPSSDDEDSDDDDNDAPSPGKLARRLIRKNAAEELRQRAQVMLQVNAADIANNAALHESSVMWAESAKRLTEAAAAARESEAKLRTEAADFKRAQEVATQAAEVTNKAADDLAAGSMVMTTASTKASLALVAAEKKQSETADAISALLDQAQHTEMSTGDEASQPLPPTPHSNIAAMQQQGDSQGSAGPVNDGSDSESSWKTASEQDELDKSQGHGQAMGPEVSESASRRGPPRVNANSVTAITGTSVKVGDSSANSHSNVSESTKASSGGSGEVMSGKGKEKGSVEIAVSVQAFNSTNSLSIQTTVAHTLPPPPPPPPPPLPLPPPP